MKTVISSTFINFYSRMLLFQIHFNRDFDDEDVSSMKENDDVL